jgi:hypothetical protein
MKAENVRPRTWSGSAGRCDRPSRPGRSPSSYMGNEFTAELPMCPGCGFILISEDLALGKMAEVEQILEDK